MLTAPEWLCAATQITISRDVYDCIKDGGDSVTPDYVIVGRRDVIV